MITTLILINLGTDNMTSITKFPKINDILSFLSPSLQDNLYLYEKYLSLQDLKPILNFYYFYHLNQCFYYKKADCYVPPYYFQFDCIDGVNTLTQILKGRYFMKKADCYVPQYYFKSDCIDGVNTLAQISKGRYFMTLVGGGKGFSVNEYHKKFCVQIEDKWLLNDGYIKI